jgi:hypothetical protein
MDDPFEGLEVEEEPTKAQNPATIRQRNFLAQLLNQRDVPEDHPVMGRNLVELSFPEASQFITELTQMPKKGSLVEPPEGVHRFIINDADAEHQEHIYIKVQRAYHGSGRLYAKMWNGESWEYLGRTREFWALSTATLLTLDEAQNFGHLYGVCCVCGRTLTDEVSIEAGIGPICADRISERMS